MNGAIPITALIVEVLISGDQDLSCLAIYKGVLARQPSTSLLDVKVALELLVESGKLEAYRNSLHGQETFFRPKNPLEWLANS